MGQQIRHVLVLCSGVQHQFPHQGVAGSFPRRGPGWDHSVAHILVHDDAPTGSRRHFIGFPRGRIVKPGWSPPVRSVPFLVEIDQAAHEAGLSRRSVRVSPIYVGPRGGRSLQGITVDVVVVEAVLTGHRSVGRQRRNAFPVHSLGQPRDKEPRKEIGQNGFEFLDGVVFPETNLFDDLSRQSPAGRGCFFAVLVFGFAIFLARNVLQASPDPAGRVGTLFVVVPVVICGFLPLDHLQKARP
mmetsp:Transcript_22789/g.53814  ORF Transcript_22789/g.53814 Transcript_22789/m.53814 type:complete len:242 (+) Transcript_22789:2524-3249(+)